MNRLVWIFIANIIRARLDYLYDMEKAEGKSSYLNGRKDATLAILNDITDYLASEGICPAREFMQEAVPAVQR
jgi:hypothetical protein